MAITYAKLQADIGAWWLTENGVNILYCPNNDSAAMDVLVAQRQSVADAEKAAAIAAASIYGKAQDEQGLWWLTVNGQNSQSYPDNDSAAMDALVEMKSVEYMKVNGDVIPEQPVFGKFRADHGDWWLTANDEKVLYCPNDTSTTMDALVTEYQAQANYAAAHPVPITGQVIGSSLPVTIEQLEKVAQRYFTPIQLQWAKVYWDTFTRADIDASKYPKLMACWGWIIQAMAIAQMGDLAAVQPPPFLFIDLYEECQPIMNGIYGISLLANQP